MEEKHGESEQNEFNVTELDDKDLGAVSGGDPNLNCGCGEYPFAGSEGFPNANCGCPS